MFERWGGGGGGIGEVTRQPAQVDAIMMLLPMIKIAMIMKKEAEEDGIAQRAMQPQSWVLACLNEPALENLNRNLKQNQNLVLMYVISIKNV
jgi:hypothetical protein